MPDFKKNLRILGDIDVEVIAEGKGVRLVYNAANKRFIVFSIDRHGKNDIGRGYSDLLTARKAFHACGLWGAKTIIFGKNTL
jgi:hypothetical protein